MYSNIQNDLFYIRKVIQYIYLRIIAIRVQNRRIQARLSKIVGASAEIALPDGQIGA
jgi:hypothetical protein